MKKLETILWVIAMLKNVTGNVTGERVEKYIMSVSEQLESHRICTDELACAR